MSTRCVLAAVLLLATILLSENQAGALAITSLSPSAYQTAALEVGMPYYVDASHTITSVPLALNGGTLIRTRSSDTYNSSLNFRFNIDVRAQVYVCYDSRASTPSWLSSWVETDMMVGVSNSTVGQYRVFSKRFEPGLVQLTRNYASTMYFVVVKESLTPALRNGWVLLSYDMPYLREVIKKAPEYDVNHIHLSHDIMMNTYQVLYETTRRANVNELIDLAHAYGVTEVMLWSHEICTAGMPSEYRTPVGHPAVGHSDGNNPALWDWIKQRYIDLLSAGTGCPEADGIIMTFSEVDDNVYQHEGDGNPGLPSGTGPSFKHDGFTQQQSVAMLINTVQQACVEKGKLLFARTWGSSATKWEQPIIRDGILLNGDSNVWMMNKNVSGIDWPYMDNYQWLIGSLPSQYNELIEFDIGSEYFGRSSVTYCLTPYFKQHWNFARGRGADGAVARIDRGDGMAYYSGNRLNMYAFKRILANPYVDPQAVNLEWCLQHFPPEIAQDIADHYDDPGTSLQGDTRYMAWEAFFPSLCPIDYDQAMDIACEAIRRIGRNRSVLEQQTTLNTRSNINDFETLYNGIANAIIKLGGAIPDYDPPTVPTGVQATALSPGSVKVTWLPSSDHFGVEGYKVYRRSTLAGVVGGDNTSFTDIKLQPNTAYSYTVVAYDAAQNHSGHSSPPAVATTPDDTEPPSMPTGLQAQALSAASVCLTWTASTDNGTLVGYKIFRGGAHIGSSIGPGYTDTGLGPDTTYSYTVSAYDAGGNHSAQSSPPAVVMTPVIPYFCSIDMGSTDTDNQLRRVSYNDGDTTGVMAGGLNCRRPLAAGDQYFYFDIDDAYIYDGSTSTVFLEVCYFDESGLIEPQYDSAAGAYTSLPAVSLTGTGRWRTATWTMNDCLFANRQNNGADFRLFVGANAVKIDSVRVSKIPYQHYGSVERDMGINEAYLGLSHPQYDDGDTISALMSGVYCRRPAAVGDNYFYFNVFDAIIYDGSFETVYLKVRYYDSTGGMLRPEYDSVNNEYTSSSTVYLTGTNTWKEHVWTLTNAKFANRQNVSADFRLYVGTEQNVYLDTITVSKVPFGDDEAPSVPSNVTATRIRPSEARISWAASTDNVGVAGYRVFRDGIERAVTANTGYIDNWISAEQTYEYRVAAYDLAGNESPQSVPAESAATVLVGIKDAKLLPDGAHVALQSQVVTAVFGHFIYVCESDRHSGIRIVPMIMPDGLQIGSIIDVGGVTGTINGERCILQASVAPGGSE